MASLATQTVPVFVTLALEHPFAWKKQAFYLNREIQFFSSNTNLTISFIATRTSKILGYFPLIGTIIGVSRIYGGYKEYKLFKLTHLHSLSHRSINWIVRGLIESMPILGGIICIIIDIVATLIHKRAFKIDQFEDDTPCGYCHECGYCKC